MNVNHEYQFISISVPKTGSTSIHYALMNATRMQFKTKSEAPAVYHMTAQDIRLIMGERAYFSYYSFGMVRNPYDRLVSLYHDFHDQRGMIKANSFDEFVQNGFLGRWRRDVHFLPQTFFLKESEMTLTTKVFLFENGVENCFRTICKDVGVEAGDIGHARKSERADWREYYSNPETRRIVTDAYMQDFVNFGYSFES